MVLANKPASIEKIDKHIDYFLELLNDGKLFYDKKTGHFSRVLKNGRIRVVKRKNTKGYIQLYSKAGGVERTQMAHRLAYAYCYGKEYIEGVQINHFDGVKDNNAIDNIEVLTGSENISHAYENGLIKSKPRKRNKKGQFVKHFKGGEQS